MDKICPECEGYPWYKCGYWEHTYKKVPCPECEEVCQTCNGKGTIPEDKIKEEFKKIFKDVDFTDEDIPEFVLKAQCYEGFEACYKSRDGEIKKLRDALERIDVLITMEDNKASLRKYITKDTMQKIIINISSITAEVLKES